MNQNKYALWINILLPISWIKKTPPKIKAQK